MKQILSLLIVCSVLVSCRNRDNDELPPRNETGERIIEQEEDGIDVNFNGDLDGIDMIPLPIQGTWKVTEYSKRKVNNSQLFDGYVLAFNADGTVDVMEGDTIVTTGTYEVVPTNDSNDLVITLPKGSPVPNLNYTWTNVSVEEGVLSFEYTDKDLVLESLNN